MSPRARKAYARVRCSVIAETPRMAEHPELGDVAAEEEGDGPVGHDAQFSGEERQLVEVVRAGHEPAEEAGQAQIEHGGNALVAAERRDLSERAVAVRLRLSGPVLREAAGLAERVLRRRRVGLARCGGVRHAGAVA